MEAPAPTAAGDHRGLCRAPPFAPTRALKGPTTCTIRMLGIALEHGRAPRCEGRSPRQRKTRTAGSRLASLWTACGTPSPGWSQVGRASNREHRAWRLCGQLAPHPSADGQQAYFVLRSRVDALEFIPDKDVTSTGGAYLPRYYRGFGGSIEDIIYREPLAKSVVRPSFCLRRRGEGWSADGMQRSQDGSGRHRRGSGVGRIHEVLLPVMRASTRDEMWRISFTSRSSSRLFSIHSL